MDAALTRRSGIPMPRPLPNVGDRIRMTGLMPNDPDPIPVGTPGTVTGINESSYGAPAQIDVEWDNGRGLLLLSTDPYEVTHDSRFIHQAFTRGSDGLDNFTVACNCGWDPKQAYSTREAARAAGEVHLDATNRAWPPKN